MTPLLIVGLILAFIGVLCLLIVAALCDIAGRLDEQEDVYLKEWEERHG